MISAFVFADDWRAAADQSLALQVRLLPCWGLALCAYYYYCYSGLTQPIRLMARK
jgi:hypothetical protein